MRVPIDKSRQHAEFATVDLAVKLHRLRLRCDPGVDLRGGAYGHNAPVVAHDQRAVLDHSHVVLRLADLEELALGADLHDLTCVIDAQTEGAHGCGWGYRNELLEPHWAQGG